MNCKYEWFYVRQGASSVQASPGQIYRMIKDSECDVFEEMHTVVQNLFFREAEHTFMRYKVDFYEEDVPNMFG